MRSAEAAGGGTGTSGRTGDVPTGRVEPPSSRIHDL